MNTQISSEGNAIIKTFVLEGETVRSLMDSFLVRVNQSANQEIAASFQEHIDKVITLVENVSPKQVEEGEISRLAEESKLLVSIVNSDNKIIDDYLNTLNLCVVGLGTKVRGKIS